MMRIFSSFAAFFTLVFAVFGWYDVSDAGDFNNSSWMAELDGSQYISEISIPGTHDSGALYEPIVPVAKCQDYSIRDQLEMGVRFLDVRVFMIFGSPQISHGIIFQGQNFYETVETCKSFLEENPDETIIFSLKGEGSILSGKTLTDVITQQISGEEELWFTENRIPELDEVRGKIVLFNRYNPKSELGIIASSGWEDSESFEIEAEDFSIHVQDCYDLSDSEEIETVKLKETLDFFDGCLEETDWQKNLHINFVSARIGNGLPDITSVSDVMNVEIKDYIEATGEGNYGIVILDFADSELCEKIIETNF